MKDPRSLNSRREKATLSRVLRQGGFSSGRKGYEPQEVKLVLNRLVDRTRRLAQRVTELEAEVAALTAENLELKSLPVRRAEAIDLTRSIDEPVLPKRRSLLVEAD